MINNSRETRSKARRDSKRKAKSSIGESSQKKAKRFFGINDKVDSSENSIKKKLSELKDKEHAIEVKESKHNSFNYKEISQNREISVIHPIDVECKLK